MNQASMMNPFDHPPSLAPLYLLTPSTSSSSILKRKRPTNNNRNFYTDFQSILKEGKKAEWRMFRQATKQTCTSNRPPCIRCFKEFCIIQKGCLLELLENYYREIGKQSGCKCVNYGPHYRFHFWTPSTHSKFPKRVRGSIKW